MRTPIFSTAHARISKTVSTIFFSFHVDDLWTKPYCTPVAVFVDVDFHLLTPPLATRGDAPILKCFLSVIPIYLDEFTLLDVNQKLHPFTISYLAYRSLFGTCHNVIWKLETLMTCAIVTDAKRYPNF